MSTVICKPDEHCPREIDAPVSVVGTYDETHPDAWSAIFSNRYYVDVKYKGSCFTVKSKDVYIACQKDKNINVRGIIHTNDGVGERIRKIYLATDES